jgi:hypothetical protein
MWRGTSRLPRERSTRVGITVIRVSGGFTDGVDGDHGYVDGVSMYCQPDETALAFLDRMVATAKAGGFVTIGGFGDAVPDNPISQE